MTQRHFNRWSGIEVVSAEPGSAIIAMPARRPDRCTRRHRHAVFAAATLVGRVLASHYSVNCLRPAVGHRFIARAKVVKPGKSQVFTACELHARATMERKLVATGETLLLVVGREAGP
jgi:acyl-coenzyme A thioesterase PaaI-like protein